MYVLYSIFLCATPRYVCMYFQVLDPMSQQGVHTISEKVGCEGGGKYLGTPCAQAGQLNLRYLSTNLQRGLVAVLVAVEPLVVICS